MASKQFRKAIGMKNETQTSPKKTATVPSKITASPLVIAQMFDLNEGTLANLRSKKQGPKFYKIGRRVLYRPSEVESWLTANPVLTTDSLPCNCGGNCEEACHE
jgi:hypothetical protein